MKPISTNLTSFYDAEFEQRFDQLEKEQQPLMEVLGRQHGSEGKPRSRQEYSVLTLNNLRSSIQNVIEFNHSRFQPTTDVASIQDMRKQAEEKIRDKENEKKEAPKKEAVISAEQKELKRKLNRKISHRMRIIIPALFGICEGFVTFDMLKSSSMPTMVSIFLSLLVALAAGFGTFFAADYINKAKTSLRRRIRYFIVLVIAFGVAAALGVWRGISYGNIIKMNSEIGLSDSTVPAFNPWPFIIVSFVAFLVALAFELMFWINEEERKLLRKYDDNKQELKKISQLIEAANNTIEKVRLELSQSSSLTMRRLEYAKSNEYRLLSLAERLQTQYESLNIEYRKDNICPDFFGEPINGFKTYFVQLFQKIQHENQ